MSSITRAVTTTLAAGAMVVATSAAAQAARTAPSIPDVAPETISGQPLQWDNGDSANQSTVNYAVSCDYSQRGPSPRVGRYWFYYDGTNSLDQLTGELTVTQWKKPRAALADLTNDGGPCTLVEGFEPTVWEGTDPSTHLLVTNGDDYAAFVVKDSYIVAVLADDWSGDAATPEESRDAAIAGVEATLANL